VIIEVQQDEKTIKKVLEQVAALSPKEIILVVNGSRDSSVDRILSHQSAIITSYVYTFPLGQDVWRSVGAREANGDVWLFLDGSSVIAAEDLQPFVTACYQGLDVSLRRIKTAEASSKSQVGFDKVALAKFYLNQMLDQPVKSASMIDLPFAITRQAAFSIGIHHLLVPPLAHAIAVNQNLRVEQSHRVKEMRRPRIENRSVGPQKRMEMRLGDHLEAVHYLSTLKANAQKGNVET
jgi:glycosyltransferase involved in cell wall biosynthesis